MTTIASPASAVSFASLAPTADSASLASSSASTSTAELASPLVSPLGASDSGPIPERVYTGLLTNVEARRALRMAWKTYVADPSKFATGTHNESNGPSARDIAVYSLLMGKPLHRAFTPVTNPTKLANGQVPYASAISVLRGLAHAHRGLDLYQLLTALGLFLEVPSERVGNGTRLAYRSFPLRDALIEAGRAVTQDDLLKAWSADQAAQAHAATSAADRVAGQAAA